VEPKAKVAHPTREKESDEVEHCCACLVRTQSRESTRGEEQLWGRGSTPWVRGYVNIASSETVEKQNEGRIRQAHGASRETKSQDGLCEYKRGEERGRRQIRVPSTVRWEGEKEGCV
jgi:hypothetical protein